MVTPREPTTTSMENVSTPDVIVAAPGSNVAFSTGALPMSGVSLLGLRQTVPYYQSGWSIWHVGEDPNLDGQHCVKGKLPDELFQGPCAEFLRWSRYMLGVSRVLQWGKNGATPVESRKRIPRVHDAVKRSYARALSSMGYKARDFFPTAWTLKVLEYYDEWRMAEFQDQA